MAGIIFSESTGVNDSVFGKSQAPIKAMVEQSVESCEQFSAIDKVFCIEKSENYAEKFTEMTALGDFKDVGENGPYPMNGKREGYSKVITPLEWKNMFAVSKAMLEDKKFGDIKGSVGAFAQSYSRTREKFAASLIAGGIGTSIVRDGKRYDTTGADGVALFSANHPSITQAKYTQSNIFKHAFSVDALDYMQEAMQKFTDNDGNLLNVSPDTIIIPNSGALKRQVFEAVGSELDPRSSNNAVNFQLGLWNIIVWGELPSRIGDKPYFIMMDSQFNKNYRCLPWIERVPLSVRSSIDENTDANVWRGRSRFGAGFNNWRSIAICGEGLTEGTTLFGA